MGAANVTPVADAGPLLHLAEIDGLSLLTLFTHIHIPDAVWRETVEQGRIAAANVMSLGNVQRHTLAPTTVTQFVRQHHLDKLHSGERECLYLCQHLNLPLLLTDDLAVREAAQQLRLTPVGSLGVVIKAYHIGRLALTDAERYIEALYETSSLFVTKTIINLALEQLREYANRA